MKIVELTNVDFSLRHFLLPLMRGIRARGHEVVGVCAEGPLLTQVRAEGFRVRVVPARTAVVDVLALQPVQAGPASGLATPVAAAEHMDCDDGLVTSAR